MHATPTLDTARAPRTAGPTRDRRSSPRSSPRWSRRLHVAGLLAILLTAAVGALLAPAPAHAVDTVEAWDPGAANIEVYGALEGLGRASTNQGLGGDMVAGWGLARGFGAYLGTTLSANGHLADGTSELGLGILGTPLDTDHWDLDLMLDIRSATGGSETLLVSPAFELNWDRAPDLAGWGLYARAGLCMAGVQTAAGTDRLTDVCLAMGGYYTLSDRAQLLLEVDADVADGLGDQPSEFRAGGVGLGYNLVLGQTLEWVQEIRVNIPDGGEESSVSYLVGLIATLPATW